MALPPAPRVDELAPLIAGDVDARRTSDSASCVVTAGIICLEQTKLLHHSLGTRRRCVSFSSQPHVAAHKNQSRGDYARGQRSCGCCAPVPRHFCCSDPRPRELRLPCGPGLSRAFSHSGHPHLHPAVMHRQGSTCTLQPLPAALCQSAVPSGSLQDGAETAPFRPCRRLAVFLRMTFETIGQPACDGAHHVRVMKLFI